MMQPDRVADLLHTAPLERRTIQPFTDTESDLDEAWGYAVQAVARAHSVAAGERLLGAKLGPDQRRQTAARRTEALPI